MKKTVLFAVVVLFVVAMTGCTVYETEKANKLVDSANVAIKEANDNILKGDAKLSEMIDGVQKVETTEELEKLRSVAKDTIPMLEKSRDRYKEGGGKFEEAGKLKLQEKFKEYLDYKGKEMKKRGEMADAMLGIPQGLLKSGNGEDFDKGVFDKEVQSFVSKFKGLQTEADDLAAKADKIYEQNKEIFRANN